MHSGFRQWFLSLGARATRTVHQRVLGLKSIPHGKHHFAACNSPGTGGPFPIPSNTGVNQEEPYGKQQFPLNLGGGAPAVGSSPACLCVMGKNGIWGVFCAAKMQQKAEEEEE